MQIRELNLKELNIVYKVASQLHTNISYKEFEDLIYDMRYMEYKMLGVLDGEELIAFAGVAIQTTLKDKRHLMVFDFVVDKDSNQAKYSKILKNFIDDFARFGMCSSVIYKEYL